MVRCDNRPALTDRTALWNGGSNHTCFCTREGAKPRSLKAGLDTLHGITSADRLRAVCEVSFASDDRSHPFIRKTRLCRLWMCTRKSEEAAGFRTSCKPAATDKGTDKGLSQRR